jgi:hypothetical protein
MKKLAAAFLGALVLAGCGSVRYPATYVRNLPSRLPGRRRPTAPWAR